jgi:arsenate reductase
MTAGLSPVAPNSARWVAFETALRAAGLPTEDLPDAGQGYFALVDEVVVGFGGYFRTGPDALLRSAVVTPNLLGRGYGRRLVAALLERLKESGVKRVWLLTTTAEGFFRRMGFIARPRDAAPRAIEGTRQFSQTCPASAVLMCRQLD